MTTGTIITGVMNGTMTTTVIVMKTVMFRNRGNYAQAFLEGGGGGGEKTDEGEGRERGGEA